MIDIPKAVQRVRLEQKQEVIQALAVLARSGLWQFMIEESREYMLNCCRGAGLESQQLMIESNKFSGIENLLNNLQGILEENGEEE